MTHVIIAKIDSIMDDLALASDQELGGPAAGDARRNASDVADYLRYLVRSGGQLERHAGLPSSGKVAAAITERVNRRFNRQIFFSNAWCGRLLEAFGSWEDNLCKTALDLAAASAEAKEPSNRRISDLEAEVLSLRAENRQMRDEIAYLRGFVASSGRMP